MFKFKRNGGMYFFQVGRLGGSFYIKKAVKPVAMKAPAPVAFIDPKPVNKSPQMQERIAFALRMA